jgi:hypothetical protein
MLRTKILPSPILPVRAAFVIASIVRSTSASGTTASILTLGRKSTTYSAPRYSSVWPFWRPKPLTSVTVRPVTPASASASRTSSSLKGLMMAVICFMAVGGGSDWGVGRTAWDDVSVTGPVSTLPPCREQIHPARLRGPGREPAANRYVPRASGW